MTIDLGGLELGDAVKVSQGPSARFADFDVPGSRGAARQFIGSASNLIQVTGMLVGSNRFTYYRDMLRAMQLGRSLKLTSEEVTTVAFINGIKPAYEHEVLSYAISLEEARFLQVQSLDAVDDWSVDTGGGSITVETTPTPLEGAGILKYAAAAESSTRLLYSPSDSFDLTAYVWPSLWFRLSKITDLTSAKLGLESAGGAVEYDFVAEVLAADTWYRIRVNKGLFTTIAGTMEWDEALYASIELTFSAPQTFNLYLDDLGAYE